MPTSVTNPGETCIKSTVTRTAPTISRIEIRMVMHRLMARMIFTTHDGKISKKIVLKATRAVNMTTSVAIASRMPATPEMIEPVRSDWHRQQVFTIGPAMVYGSGDENWN